MITFSKTPVTRREFSDEPSDTSFYIIYDGASDIGEAYKNDVENSVDAYVTNAAKHLAAEIQNAIRRFFHTEYIEVNYVD